MECICREWMPTGQSCAHFITEWSVFSAQNRLGFTIIVTFVTESLRINATSMMLTPSDLLITLCGSCISLDRSPHIHDVNVWRKCRKNDACGKWPIRDVYMSVMCNRGSCKRPICDIFCVPQPIAFSEAEHSITECVQSLIPRSECMTSQHGTLLLTKASPPLPCISPKCMCTITLVSKHLYSIHHAYARGNTSGK